MLNSQTYQDKQFRGDSYEAFIAQHYRDLGCKVIEHGKEKGLKDGGIDIIAKMGNEVFLIQCKDWNVNYSHKITHKDIKVFRTDASDFLEKNPRFNTFDIKLRYTLSGDFLHKSAEKYIEECKGEISYEIIEPPYRKSEQNKRKDTEKVPEKKDISNTIKIIVGVIAALTLLVILTQKESVTKRVSHDNSKKSHITIEKTPIPTQQKKKEILLPIPTKDVLEKTVQIHMKKKAVEPQRKQMTHKEVSKPSQTKADRKEAKANLLMQMQN